MCRRRRTTAAFLGEVRAMTRQLPPWGLRTPELPRGWPRYLCTGADREHQRRVPQGHSHGAVTSQRCPWRCSGGDPTVPVATSTPAAALHRHELCPARITGAAPATASAARRGSSSWSERDGAEHVPGWEEEEEEEEGAEGRACAGAGPCQESSPSPLSRGITARGKAEVHELSSSHPMPEHLEGGHSPGPPAPVPSPGVLINRHSHIPE